ncbi:hypothetical protein J7W19_21775 [Streptomyces mobaraensis NBRC 13819 = DSM 40847]|uniref:TPM domain-containing protein n=1 Tax=Streptomyces mobaraensis (strain ATCC 29032 / DSM 40847 / JCM 4168 / NBRC 13819 / NCIMB 11159 / IPCR 16-22) TaxID=1223523 RepID=M3CFU7_STRM1|nr:hypothetical protein [Streptomyces mobaraensis]EMF02631.1 hypothetical protein H340_00510 [Streptomyces mobaraensis NBRC 13819 = DSM 40847]QTT75659.1 hypothetical protein J7W19_21775 [Streptomyces mobaraensis NBRC 13819 = DSM 40847]
MSATPRALPRPLPALFAGLVAALLLVAGGAALAPPAHAATGLNEVAEGLKKSPVYVDPRASSQLSSADADALAKKIKDADKPVFVAVLPNTPDFPQATVLGDLRGKVGISGVYAIRLGDKFNAGADRRVMSNNAVANLRDSVRRNDNANASTELNAFVDGAIKTARGHAPDSWGGSGSGGGSTGLIVIGAIVVAGAGGAYAFYRRAKKKREERERAELDALRVVVDEDITAFGEELDRLDFSPSEPGATDAMRHDYEQALDAYEEAKRRIAAAARPQEVTAVTEALDNGRFALATLAARRTGAPLPERRLPCFFDPRHGPSVEDVQWAPPGGAPRTVPACRADATRVADGEDPASRTVQTAQGPQPYWNAGPAYAPWAGGYFGGGILPGLLVGTMLGSMLSGPAYASDFGGVPTDTGPEGGDFSGSDFNSGDFGGGWGDGGGFGGGGDGGGFGGGDW